MHVAMRTMHARSQTHPTKFGNKMGCHVGDCCVDDVKQRPNARQEIASLLPSIPALASTGDPETPGPVVPATPALLQDCIQPRGAPT